jgi:hypothetical protein
MQIPKRSKQLVAKYEALGYEVHAIDEEGTVVLSYKGGFPLPNELLVHVKDGMASAPRRFRLPTGRTNLPIINGRALTDGAGGFRYVGDLTAREVDLYGRCVD